MKLVTVVASLLSLSGVAHAAPAAASAVAWPGHFSLACGDLSHKLPIDPRDRLGTLINIDVKGEGVRMDPSRLTGYWTGGVGYDVTVSVNDAKLTGFANPVAAAFQCFFRGAGLGETMTCTGSLRSLPSVPGFNTFLLALSAPHPLTLASGSTAWGSIGVRTAADVSVGDDHATRYYDTTHEFVCQYAPFLQ